MKVLLYIPLAPQTPRIYARTLTSVLNLHWYQSLDIVMGKNDMLQYPDRPAAYLDLTRKYNQARQLALCGGYDALLTVESDMILPPLALERLSRVDADVAYGLYISRHGNHKWLAYDHASEYYTGASLSDIPEEARASWGTVRETKGVGMGCTFIHRHVLEEIEFRCPDTQVANDWFFTLDLQARGLVQKHDLGVVCGHIQGAPDSKIFWPEPDGTYSVQFFEEAMPEMVSLSGGYQITVSGLETKHLFPVEVE